jgi:hypothetical protein
MSYLTRCFKVLGKRTNNISLCLMSELDSPAVRIIAVRPVCVRLYPRSSFQSQYYYAKRQFRVTSFS